MLEQGNYLHVGLEVGQLAPRFTIERLDSELTLEYILSSGPLVLEVGNKDAHIINLDTVDRINNQGANYLKISQAKNDLQIELKTSYNENSTIIYIIDRKKLICYKTVVDTEHRVNEIENILSILKIMT